MPKLEIAKSIEARKLNPRTGRPVDTLWLTIPYGAILENPTENGDLVEFSYLGEPYHCKYAELKETLKVASAAGVSEPHRAAPKSLSADSPPAPKLVWERVTANIGEARRAKIPGGWLVSAQLGDGGGLVFYPDPEHSWNSSRRG